MYKLDKFSDMDIVTLEELEEDDEEPAKIKWKKMKRWQKVLLSILMVAVFIGIGGSATFFVLRAKGGKSLKVEVKQEKADESGSDKGFFIVHKGKEYRYREDIINILCIGVDKEISMEEKEAEAGRLGLADVIVLVSIDTDKKALKMFAISRDTMTDVQMAHRDGALAEKKEMQLTYQYAYGVDTAQSGKLMMDTVSELMYRLPVHKYCAINFQALPVLNDAVGGVDITLAEDMTWWRDGYIAGTSLHLDGQTALEYLRERTGEDGGSNQGRMRRQKEYVMAYLAKAKSVLASDLSIPVTVYQQLQEHMSTNVTLDEVTYLVSELLNISVNADELQSLPGESRAGEKHEEFYVDREALKELIIQNFYEEVPNTRDKV